MSKIDPLFSLIKTLKKTEKTYFKKFTQLHTIGQANNYVELFDVINDMKVYDEQIIHDHFKGQTFLKQLHVTKNYLYKQILKSLRVYHTSDSIDSQIRELLDYTTVLYQKGFPNQAAKQLVKAKKIAEKCDKHEYLLIILRWEIRLASSEVYTGKILKKSDELTADISEVLKELNTENDLFVLTSKIFESIRSKGHIRNKEELDLLNNHLKNPLLQNEGVAQSFRSKLYYYYVLSIIYMEKNEADLSVSNALKMMDVVEDYPDQKKDEATNYILVLNHILEILIHFKRYELAGNFLNKLDNVLISTIHTERMLFLRTHILKIQVALKQGDFKKGLPSAERIIEDLKTDGIRIHDEVLFNIYFSLAHLYFGLQDYKESLRWINNILNSKRKTREDIRSIAAIFFLIVHLEIGNIDLLEYHVKSTYKSLFKKNRLFEIENILLAFIEKTLYAHSAKQMKDNYIALEAELSKVLNDADKLFEYSALDYFDFYAWVVSKIKNKSYSSVLEDNI